jgi:hypothetical protein
MNYNFAVRCTAATEAALNLYEKTVAAQIAARLPQTSDKLATVAAIMMVAGAMITIAHNKNMSCFTKWWLCGTGTLLGVALAYKADEMNRQV